MMIAPTREPDPAEMTDPVELLIKEARQKARRRRISSGSIALAVIAVGSVLLIDRGGTAERGIVRSPSSPGDAAVVGAPACTSAQLKFVDVGTPGGMAGSWEELFAFKNVSTHACSITGYPNLSITTVSGVFENLRVGTFKSAPFYAGIGIAKNKSLPKVTLRAEAGLASFWVTGTDVGVNNDACRAATSVRVNLLDGAGSMAVSTSEDKIPFYWCGNGVGETPLVPGISGSLPTRPLTHFFGSPMPFSVKI